MIYWRCFLDLLFLICDEIGLKHVIILVNDAFPRRQDSMKSISLGVILLTCKINYFTKVNKPSLRGHYIGLHSESTAKRTAAYAAFVCFQRATEGGGRFLVADGAAILAEMDTKVLQKLYDRKIRISVSNLDIPPALPGVIKEGIKGLVDVAVAPKFDMDLEMIYESDGKPGRLQAVETAESPINRHPVTGMPVWFNNAHNHARKLRDRRPCGVPEVGMMEVFYADTMEPLDLEDCMEIKR